jgi:hypothetical protein
MSATDDAKADRLTLRLERLGQELCTAMQSQADRVIERPEQVTRALIAALNERLAEKP